MSQYNDVFVDLQDYMLNEDNMAKAIRMKLERMTVERKPKEFIYDNNNNNNNHNNNVKKQQTLFIPNQQDTLFWCFYIIKNGDIKYETLNNKNSLLAKQMKIEMVDLIRKNKNIVKQYKFDTLSNIESNLANDNNLSTKCFLTLCAIENINIIFIKKNTYYELLMNDSNVIFLLHDVKSQSQTLTQVKYYNKYGFELATEESLNKIRSTFLKLDYIDKPVKAISSYKLSELINICNKLVININNNITGKQKGKKELYESIIQYF